MYAYKSLPYDYFTKTFSLQPQEELLAPCFGSGATRLGHEGVGACAVTIEVEFGIRDCGKPSKEKYKNQEVYQNSYSISFYHKFVYKNKLLFLILATQNVFFIFLLNLSHKKNILFLFFVYLQVKVTTNLNLWTDSRI